MDPKWLAQAGIEYPGHLIQELDELPPSPLWIS